MRDPSDDPDEAPPDPAVERVQQRLRRLMLISGLTLGFGIIAILGAAAYRLLSSGAGPSAVALAPGSAVPTLRRSDIGVGEAAELVASALDGDRLALTYAEAGGETVVVVDLRSMAVVARFRIAGP